jgi:hypothetical protein
LSNTPGKPWLASYDYLIFDIDVIVIAETTTAFLATRPGWLRFAHPALVQ